MFALFQKADPRPELVGSLLLWVILVQRPPQRSPHMAVELHGRDCSKDPEMDTVSWAIPKARCKDLMGTLEVLAVVRETHDGAGPALGEGRLRSGHCQEEAGQSTFAEAEVRGVRRLPLPMLPGPAALKRQESLQGGATGEKEEGDKLQGQ